MNISDVFLKLLPFTFKNDTGTHFGWAALDAGDAIITTFILVLWVIFGWALYKLWRSKRADEAMVNHLHTALLKGKGKMESRYNDFVKFVEKNKELGSLWNEFDESLIKTSNSLTNQTEIRKSIDAEYFFNKHTLLTHLGTKYYAAIPSILLGIGLIGTFFGLFYGLVQLNMGGDAESLKESMAKLINAAGVKFAASIWGLFLSLLFTFYEKYSEGILEQRIEKIQWLVNTAFKRKTAEHSLAVMEDHSKQQTSLLNNLSISLTDDSVNKLSDALGQKIKETLEVAIGKPIQQLAENIGGSPENTLYQRLNALAGGMGDGFADVMKTLLKEIVDELRGVAGTDAQQLQDTLGGLAKTLEGLQTSLTDAANKTQHATEGTLAALNIALASINQTMTKQTESLGESMRKLLDIIDAQRNATKVNIDDIGGVLIKAIVQISKAVETALANIHETFAGIKSTIEQSKDHLAPVPAYLKQFADGTKNLRDSAVNIHEASGVLGGSVQKLSGFEIAMQTAMVGFATALTAQQKELHKVSEQLTNTVTQAGKISKDSKETYELLASSYTNLLEKNKESVEQFTMQVQAYQTKADANINRTLGEFDGQLTKFAASLNGAIAELNNTVGDLTERMGRKNS